MDYRQNLINKRNQILQQMDRMRQDQPVQSYESYDELSMYNQYADDQLSAGLYERQKNQSLLELLEYELEKVNDALNRQS